eukprot:126834-Rhodomonas_salina.2
MAVGHQHGALRPDSREEREAAAVPDAALDQVRAQAAGRLLPHDRTPSAQPWLENGKQCVHRIQPSLSLHTRWPDDAF